jgi:Zn-dependent M16 (insulinase) family peptidase
MPICGYLWALSGSGGSKLWRRLAVPTIWALTVGSIFAFLMIPVAFGFLSIGYGIPDVNDPKGSVLGRFFFNLTKSMLWANILTRGLIYGGAVIPFVIGKIYG